MNYKEANEKLVNQKPPVYIEVSYEKDIWDNYMRIPVKFNKDGSVICVLSGYELSYHDGDYFQTVKYPYWRLPQQKEKRLMNSQDLWNAGAAWLVKDDHKYLMAYRGKNFLDPIGSPTGINPIRSFEKEGWKWCTDEDRQTLKDFWI